MLWWDWMSCWLLYREAKTVIDGSPPPDDPKLYVVRARALAALGDNEGAGAACDKALELASGNSDIRLDCAILLGAVRRGNEALARYRKGEPLPKTAQELNGLAWGLATCPEVKLRDPSLALELAKKAVALAPNDGNIQNTLGVAYYRAGDCNAAIEELEKSTVMRNGGDGLDWFFLAMAHGRLGEKEKALTWFDRAVQWMDKNQAQNEEFRRFRAEAKQLLQGKE